MEKYLENHLESPPLSQKEFNSAKESQKELRNLFPENVLRNLHSEFEYRENDTQRIELQEGGSLTFSYEMVTPELINELRILFRDVGTSLIQDLENGRFRRISKFVIETGSGRRLDFSTLPVRNIFFTIDNNDWVKNIAIPEKGDVIMYEPPTTFLGIINMLHEIGHLVDGQRMNSEDINISQIASNEYAQEQHSLHILPSKKRQERFDLVAEVVLNEERNAWASAISMLKPVLSAFDISREELLESIHSVSLTAYSHDIRQARIMQGGLIKVLGEIAKKLF